MYRSDPPFREGCVSPAAGRALRRHPLTLSSFSCREPSCLFQESPHPVTGHGRSIQHFSPCGTALIYHVGSRPPHSVGPGSDGTTLLYNFPLCPLPWSWSYPLPSADVDPWSSLRDIESSWKSHNPWLSSSLPPSLSFFSSGEIWTPNLWKYWVIQIINVQKS